MNKLPIISGQKINSLTFVKRLHNTALFKCDCGKIKEIPVRRVISGDTKSCGCLTYFYLKKTLLEKGHEYKKTITSHGYVSINRNYEHRLIMKDELNKYPNPSEIDIHHINGNKSDNRKENLMVVDRKTHRRIEQGWKLIDNTWFKICSNCKKEFEVNTDNFYQRKTGKFVNWCKNCMSVKRNKYR